MNKIDHLSLDGQSLRLFLQVLETGSVTGAAEKLDLTQSAVSHALQKLRRIVGSPLFVKNGRGIVATAHALSLADKARQIVDRLEDFARAPTFDPAAARLSLTIAANDFQAELLLPSVYRHLATTAARVDLRILPSGQPGAELLRERHCDLILSPIAPEGTDILRRRLFEDRYLCFYDQTVRSAPEDAGAYLSARHITVVHADGDRLDFDRKLESRAIDRDIVISVQGFAGVASFLRGSHMLASLPGLLRHNLMREFAHIPVPLDSDSGTDPALLPMYMVWHRRDHLDPAHVWLRDAVVLASQEARYPSAR